MRWMLLLTLGGCATALPPAAAPRPAPAPHAPVARVPLPQAATDRDASTIRQLHTFLATCQIARDNPELFPSVLKDCTAYEAKRLNAAR
jgi:hypothetical protein